ncbi:hypothetical protein [Vibrio sonorensis]|uniref:hypothetical protein n=1 Tax=Vibrio sonorensis TaxID=1004316 RepID=UPI0008D9D9F3|nr:hypothetical protein [Vibrio sonorensis]
MKYSIETLMSNHSELWQEVRNIPMDKLAILIDLMNGETTEPAGRETATKQLDKEDALISSLKLDHLMPISSVLTGKGQRKAHLISLNDLEDLLNNREAQRKRIKRELAAEQEKRTEKDLQRSIGRYGLDWTLRRAKAVNRKSLKTPELDNCSRCGYEQLADDLFYGGCIKCGEFEAMDAKRV